MPSNSGKVTKYYMDKLGLNGAKITATRKGHRRALKSMRLLWGEVREVDRETYMRHQFMWENK